MAHVPPHSVHIKVTIDILGLSIDGLHVVSVLTPMSKFLFTAKSLDCSGLVCGQYIPMSKYLLD